MAFPGRPAHDFSSPYSRTPAGRFPSRPHAPPPGVGPSLSFPARYRPWAVPARGGCAGPCCRAVEACDEGGCDVRDGVGR